MLVSIHYKLSLFKAHAMFLVVHIFMTVNKLCDMLSLASLPFSIAFRSFV